MGRRRAARLGLALTGLALPYGTASANTTEDLLGVGARTTAMGGAGTALDGDFTAAYYNPAALTRCSDDHMAVDIRHTMYALRTTRIGADAPPAGTKTLRDLTRVSTGFCFSFPYNLAMGVNLGFGLQSPMTLDASAPSSRPQFAMYGDTLEQLSINLGFAYEPIPQLSLGFGGSILVSTDLSFGASVPIANDQDGDGLSDPLDVTLRLNIVPTGAPYVGVQLRPIEALTVGLTFRGAMYLELDVPATIRADLLGLAVQIPIQVTGQGWYTPTQFAIGLAGRPNDDLTLTADVTYYRYSGIGGAYYPFLAIGPQDGYDDTIVGQLGFSRMSSPGWRDIWVPRIGGELKFMDSRLAIRGGYSFRPAALPLPGSRTDTYLDAMNMPRTRVNPVTLLDNNTHSLSLGGGYYFGDRPDERDAPDAADEAAPTEPTTEAYVLPYDADGYELAPVRGAQTRPRTGTQAAPPQATPPSARPGQPAPAAGARPGQPAPATGPARPGQPTTTASAPPPSPVTAPVNAPAGTAASPADETNPLPESEADPDSDLPGITGQVDLMFRVQMLQERVDVVKDIRYGGSIYDVGVMLTLGWY